MAYDAPTLHVLPVSDDQSWIPDELPGDGRLVAIENSITCTDLHAGMDVLAELRVPTREKTPERLTHLIALQKQLWASKLPKLDTAYRVAAADPWLLDPTGENTRAPIIRVDEHGFGFDDPIAAAKLIENLAQSLYLANQSEYADYLQLLAYHVELMPTGFAPIAVTPPTGVDASLMVAAAHMAGTTPAALALGQLERQCSQR